MEYTVKALAELSGVTPRTLRWYDREGLLKPCRVNAAGYRIYGPGEVDRLQQILCYRELGLALSAIRTALDDPHFDRKAALQSHLAALEERRARLDALILTVKNTIGETEGGPVMSDKEKFEGFKREVLAENEARYGTEIREKYGEEAVDASNQRFSNLTREAHQRMTAMEAELQTRLEAAVRAGTAPDGAEGAAIAALHRDWLSFTWSSYTPEAHAGLGQLYVSDARFTAHYDKAVPGCARFLCDAIAAYVTTL